jgi:predicted deacetylase
VTASRWLVVSVHDVTPPHWDLVQRMLSALDEVGVHRRSLLVIPNFQGRWPIDEYDGFCSGLRDHQGRGDEMVLHGYEHVGVGPPDGLVARFKNRWFTQNEGEFLSLDYHAARDRIERGLELTRRTGLNVRGFIAPAWLVNPQGLRAARDCGFDYTNSYLWLVDLVQSWSRFAPGLVFGPGHLNEDLGILLQRPLSELLSHHSIVRIVLHPPCIDHPHRFEQILSMIRTQLAGHEPVTYCDLMSRLRSSNTASQGSIGAS